MKSFKEFLEEGVLDTINTTLNQTLNPIRRTLGVKTGELPPGTKEVDYGSMVKTFDKAMSGFGGADPARKGVSKPKPVSSKMQDRVPQEKPRDPIDTAPSNNSSVVLQRQAAGDKPPVLQTMKAKLDMMRLKNNVDYNRFKEKMDKDFETALTKNNGKAEPQRPVVTPDKPRVGSDDAVAKLLASKGYDRTGKKIVKQEPVVTAPVEKQKPPIPKPRPDGLAPKKTFAQAFRDAPEGSEFKWNNKTYKRITAKPSKRR